MARSSPSPNGRATIEDVAAQAGVSVATVSRALRGLPRVATSTREHVQLIADKLDYRADPHASRLAAGRTQTIAMVVHAIDRFYESAIVAGASAALAERGYDVLLVILDKDPTRLGDEFRRLQRRVDGVLLINLEHDASMSRESVSGETAVAVPGRPDSQRPSVTGDHAGAIHAVNHVVGLGHRDIAIVGPPRGLAASATMYDARRAGYLTALRKVGIELKPEFDVASVAGVEGGAEAAKRLITLDHRPGVVLALSDEIAAGCVRAVRSAGRHVPDDVLVVGFGDGPLAAALGLSTVREPLTEMGATAAAMLLDSMSPPHIAETTTLPTTFVIRDTA